MKPAIAKTKRRLGSFGAARGSEGFNGRDLEVESGDGSREHDRERHASCGR